MTNERCRRSWLTGAVALACATGGLHPARGDVTLLSGLINIPASGPFAPAVCYNATSDQYLVLWRDVTDPTGWQTKGVRVDADTGAVLDAPFFISDNPASLVAVTSQVAYNAVNGEWLVVYQASLNGSDNDVFGQRLASDGTKVGGHLVLSAKAKFQSQADVAHDPSRNRYLVVWRHTDGTGQPQLVEGRRFDANGSPIGGEIPISNGTIYTHGPHVAYNPVVDEFMVVWQDGRHWPGVGQDNDYADIYGQRIHAGTGVQIGANIPVLSPINSPPYVPDGHDAPDGIVCNPTDGRYAIGFTKLTGALGWTTLGLVMNADGSLVRPPVNLSHPSFGAQARPAYHAATNTYFISYEGPSNNVAGKEISAAGNLISGAQTIVASIGGIRDNDIAARPAQGDFLQVAVSDNGTYVAQRFMVGEDIVAPGPVQSFTATAGGEENLLAWVNPADSDFTGTMIRYATDAHPANPTEGTLAVDLSGQPGAMDSYSHEGLSQGVTYYYAAFARDGSSNYAPPAQAEATPWARSDFNRDNDVDSGDFAFLQQCYSGTGIAYRNGCEEADLLQDGVIDEGDLAVFLSCMNGTNVPPGC